MRRVIVPAIAYDSSGWKASGFDRVRGPLWTNKHYDKYDLIVNLGRAAAHPNHGDNIIYNPSPVAYATNNLKKSQELFDELMPPSTGFESGDSYWVKTPGYGGNGKDIYQYPHGPLTFGPGAIVQKHIEGVEYRVVTVGPMVVQVFRKDKKPNGGVGDFDWTWVGVSVAASIVGLIPTAKSAAAILSDYVGHDRHVIGWDIIRDDQQRAWLIEGNSAPGCNDKTAARIWAAIQTLEKLNVS